MRFQTPLQPARLIRRYKRFLADCVLESGEEVIAHCPNPGAMTGMAEPGQRIWLEPNSDPRKKLRYSWKLVECGSGLAVVDTMIANRVVSEALNAQSIPELKGFTRIRREVPFGDKSRIDFHLYGGGRLDMFLEVKSVTLCRSAGCAEFPDTTTARGARHLRDLAEAVSAGARAMIFYLVQRDDATHVDVARDIDPAYGAAFDDARAIGVEALAYRSDISIEGVTLGPALPLS